jgi:hypothetical protein
MQPQFQKYELNKDGEILICRLTSIDSLTTNQLLVEIEDHLSKLSRNNSGKTMLVFDFGDREVDPHVVFRTGALIKQCTELGLQVACIIQKPALYTTMQDVIFTFASEDIQCEVFRHEHSGLMWLTKLSD